MIKSTKTFDKLPCAHSQYFATDSNGEPGECAAIHGYDRSVKFTFAGDIDPQGWVFPFGHTSQVRDWLKFYFDHTTVLGADDPRLEQIDDKMVGAGGLFKTLRVLPSGVSMEMSALFIFEHVNPFIYSITGGRVVIDTVEVREHDANGASITVPLNVAKAQAAEYKAGADFLPKRPYWDFEPPQDALFRVLLSKQKLKPV